MGSNISTLNSPYGGHINFGNNISNSIGVSQVGNPTWLDPNTTPNKLPTFSAGVQIGDNSVSLVGYLA